METTETQSTLKTSKKSIYERFGSYALSFLVIILPLFIIPLTHVGFLYAKFGLIVAVVIITSICFILHVMNNRKIGVPPYLYLGVFLFLPLSYFIASLFSKDIGLSLMGQGTDVDTFFFIALGSILMFLVARFFGDKRKVFIAALSFILVSLVISLFHILRYVFGVNFLSFGIFNTVTSNTIGSFSDLGIYAGLAVILSILSLEFLTLSKVVRVGLYTALALSLVVACVSNFYFTSSILGINIPIALSAVLAFFSLIIFVHKKVSNPKNTFPFVTLIVFLVTLVFTVQAQNITAAIASAIHVTNGEALDVRVSPVGTIAVASKVLSESVRSALVGVGPNRFSSAWALYKPIGQQNSINLTDYWNTDFNLAFGFIPTALITGGSLEAIAWVAFLLLVLYSIYRLFKSVLKPQKERDPLVVYAALVASISTLYLWFVAFVYTPGPVILPLAFFFTGMLAALLVNEGVIEVRHISWEKVGYWKSFGIVFGLVIAISVCIGVAYEWTNRFVAAMYVDKAVSVLQSTTLDIDGAETSMAKAIGFYRYNAYLRLFSDITLIRPSQLIAKNNNGIVPADQVTQDVVNDMYKSITLAEFPTIASGPSLDYRDWLQLGKVYETATFLGATSTAQRALAAYSQAEVLNPTNPIAPFLMGRLYLYARQRDLAIAEFTKALELKPNYSAAASYLDTLNSAPVSPPTPEPTPTPKSATSTKAVVKPAAKSAATTSPKK